jgi:hypothetical protein
MRTTMTSHNEARPPIHPPGTDEPGQAAVTVIACLVILLAFIVIAALA